MPAHLTRVGLVAALLSASAALAQAAPPRDFAAQDLVTLDRVSDPHLSPDGTRVVYDLRSTDLAHNKAVHAIWIAGAAAAPARLAASDGGATNPRWAPDGKSIYVLSSRSKSAQVWRTGADGQHAVQVTNLPLPVGAFALAPDGHTLVVSLPVFPDCETPTCTKQRLDARQAGKASGRLFDKLFIRHWDEWADGTRNHLFALHLDPTGAVTGTPVPLMPHFDGDVPSKPFGDDTDFTISPDSHTLVFSARVAGRTEPWSTNFDLFQVSLDGNAATPPRNLTASNPAWDGTPVFSPDGKSLAYKAMKRPGFEADRFGIMIRDMETGATREIDPHWDRSIDSLIWAPDGKRLLVTLPDQGHEILAQMDVATGAATPLTHDGHAAAVTAAASRIVIARDSLAGPAELYDVKADGLKRLTFNTQSQMQAVHLAKYEQFSFPGWNGEKVSGYVMQPANFDPGQKYPVAFIIHGGPQSSFGDAWSYRWNPQFYAGAGFAAVFIDFHGSPGYGQAFTDSISAHWGDRPLEDLQKGWHAALAKYPFLDANRACALGASYGGFMVYWIEGNWSAPWKCLVDHDGVFDNRMMGYATEELWFSEWENGHTTPWQSPANYERFNPIDHVAAWTKPMLIIHSAQDFRIPLDQGLAAFTALQRRDVPSELLTFPDENHWVLKPANSLQWHATVLDWLKRWTK
jgi:acylaminoacyl-peptidase